MLAVLGPLLSLLGLEAGELKTRFKREAIVWSIVGGLGVIAISFLMLALNNALTLLVGPTIAPLAIAGAAVVIALVVLLVTRLLDNAEARRMAQKKHSAEVTSLITAAALTAVPLILRSPLFRDLGIPVGAALASALWFRKPDDAAHR